MFDVPAGEQLVEVGAACVVPGVVCHDRVDVYTAAGEVLEGAGEKRGRGRALLVVEDLRVRETTVVIDDGVHVVVADAGFLVRVRLAHLSPVRAPASAVGDPTDLLDVHMDQFARPFTFVTHGGG